MVRPGRARESGLSQLVSEEVGGVEESRPAVGRGMTAVEGSQGM